MFGLNTTETIVVLVGLIAIASNLLFFGIGWGTMRRGMKDLGAWVGRIDDGLDGHITGHAEGKFNHNRGVGD